MAGKSPTATPAPSAIAKANRKTNGSTGTLPDGRMASAPGARAGEPHSQHRSHGPASQAEYDAFGDQLADDATTAGAESRSNADLPGASHGTGEHQISDVEAPDEQHAYDGPEQNRQGPARVACEIVVQGNDRCPCARGFAGVRRLVARGDTLELRSRLFDRDPARKCQASWTSTVAARGAGSKFSL